MCVRQMTNGIIKTDLYMVAEKKDIDLEINDDEFNILHFHYVL